MTADLKVKQLYDYWKEYFQRCFMASTHTTQINHIFNMLGSAKVDCLT